jgi:hypothetical protein
MHFLRESFDAFEIEFDCLPNRLCRGDFRIPQPIMANHSAFVRICDGAPLQSCHGFEGPLNTSLHLGEMLALDVHPTKIQRQLDPGEVVVEFFEVLPGSVTRSVQLRFHIHQFRDSCSLRGWPLDPRRMVV